MVGCAMIIDLNNITYLLEDINLLYIFQLFMAYFNVLHDSIHV